MGNKYYLKARPFSPGAAPIDGFINFENYDERRFIEDAGCRVWGWIEYDKPLDYDVIDRFEFAESGHAPYYCARLRKDTENNTVKLIGQGKLYLIGNPLNHIDKTGRYVFYTTYFKSAAECDAYVTDMINGNIM